MAFLMNPAQTEVVEADGPVLCCACPGSGKTRVLVERTARLLSLHPCARILMTTFSRDAATEMQQRIARHFEDTNNPRGAKAARARVTFGTFHSLALEQLRAAGWRGRILSQIEVDHLISAALTKAGSRLAREIPFDEAEELIAAVRMDEQMAQAHPGAVKLAKIYAGMVRERNAVDFTDIMLSCVEGMEAGTIKPHPADYLLLDEFQDIDRLQFRWMMAHIAAGAIACAVGDDDQSIYGFRRALGYGGMMEFVAATGAKIVTLADNYRSTARILAMAGRMIDCNDNRIRKNMRAFRGDGLEPKVRPFNLPEDQTDYVIATLDDICCRNPVKPPPHGRKPYRFAVRPGQVAVLARTHQNLRAIEKAMIESNIPYARTGGVLTDPAVLVFRSLLSSLDKADGLGVEVALRWAGMGSEDLHELHERCLGRWLELDRSKLPGGAAVGYFFEHYGTWINQARNKPAGVINGVAGWMVRVLARHWGEGSFPDREALDKSVANSIDAVEAMRDLLAGNMKGSLAQRLLMAQREKDDDLPRVVLSTFHASKGLEWDHVFLLDVTQGVVPSLKAKSAIAIEEERRLFYVAMTRARDSLHILTQLKRTKNRQGVSEFLRDAGWGEEQGMEKAA